MSTGRFSELIGRSFNKLTVTGLSSVRQKDGSWQMDCICECGNTKRLPPNMLVSGRAKSCGCLSKSRLINWESYVGKQIYELTVLDLAGLDKNGDMFANVECSCGEIKSIRLGLILRGISKSCGHTAISGRAGERHGWSKTATYSSWQHLKSRCNNPAENLFDRYGGRGISYDPRWELFSNFLKDMGRAPDGTSIERLDNNGNYTKDNCVWATQAEQMRNTNRNVNITLGGVTACKADWANALGFKGNPTVDQIINRYKENENE